MDPGETSLTVVANISMFLPKSIRATNSLPTTDWTHHARVPVVSLVRISGPTANHYATSHVKVNDAITTAVVVPDCAYLRNLEMDSLVIVSVQNNVTKD